MLLDRGVEVGKAKVDVILRYVSYLGNSFIYLVGLTLCLRKRRIALKSLPSPSPGCSVPFRKLFMD